MCANNAPNFAMILMCIRSIHFKTQIWGKGRIKFANYDLKIMISTAKSFWGFIESWYILYELEYMFMFDYMICDSLPLDNLNIYE